jgi:hypothetical protein
MSTVTIAGMPWIDCLYGVLVVAAGAAFWAAYGGALRSGPSPSRWDSGPDGWPGWEGVGQAPDRGKTGAREEQRKNTPQNRPRNDLQGWGGRK